MSSIQIKNVSKKFGKAEVLSQINLNFEENKIYGLLGRNGVGKTTLLNMISNRIFPTKGEILVDGDRISEKPAIVGKIFYMTEKNLYPEGMTVEKAYMWTHAFYDGFDMEKAIELSRKFGLDIKKKMKSLSTGYHTIFKTITTLASNAPIMIFDEPILGMDANHREIFYKEVLNSYIENPKTIILSTHIIEEIADLLERVVIINDESIMLDEEVAQLIEKAYTVSGREEKVNQYIQDKDCIHEGIMASFKSATIKGSISELDRELIESLELEVARVELQKLFIYLTGTGGKW